MSNKKVYLTYSAENQDVVNQIVADLGRVGIEFIQDTRNPISKASMKIEWLQMMLQFIY